MTEAATDRPKRNWLVLIATTFMGIAATVSVGWYQLNQAEKQASLAEEERARAVRQNLVSIVEEHVLNDKPIDVPRLTRLIDQRRRDERVATPITTAELLEKAEFNILETRYLAFERKQALKKVFDALYSDLSTRAFAQYPPETANANLLNTLARQVQDGKTSEALNTLKRLQEAHVTDLQEARSGRRPQSVSDVLNELLKDPWPILLTLIAYVVFLVWLIQHRSQVGPVIRRFLGPRLSPTEVRETIIRYKKAGMPDDLILARLLNLGVPRGWALTELAQPHGPETRPDDSTTSKSAKPAVEQTDKAD